MKENRLCAISFPVPAFANEAAKCLRTRRTVYWTRMLRSKEDAAQSQGDVGTLNDFIQECKRRQ